MHTSNSHRLLTERVRIGTIVNDSEMGEVIQLQGDQRKDVQDFLIDKKEGLELDAKTIKVRKSRQSVIYDLGIASYA